jgi:hypothetical protein
MGTRRIRLPLEYLRRLLTLFAVRRVTSEFVAAGRPFAGLSDTATDSLRLLPRQRLRRWDFRISTFGFSVTNSSGTNAIRMPHPACTLSNRPNSFSDSS